MSLFLNDTLIYCVAHYGYLFFPVSVHVYVGYFYTVVTQEHLRSDAPPPNTLLICWELNGRGF